MKFERVRARAFGRFEEFDSGSTPLPDLNVVVGPNESGKTTFFHLLHSILFGLYPASKDQHPYTPWSGRDVDVEAEVRLDDGEQWTIHRKLAGSPTGRLTRNESVEDVRNQTLACASHVTREVFRQVFALTLTEVASLESRAWSEIQDRLIGGMGARDVVSARATADALDTEAQRLWRPNRRGRQEIRVLREKLHQARAARGEALQADRLLRESMRELERTQEAMRAARIEREQKRLLIERITRLLPTRERLDQAARLEMEAGPHGALEGLPADPRTERERLRSEIASLESRLEKAQSDAQEPQERAEAFAAHHRAILDAGRRIDEASTAAAAAGPVSARLTALQQEIRDRKRRIESDAPQLFERTLTSQEASTLRTLVARDLHDRVRDASAARDRLREHTIRRTLAGALPEPSPRTLASGLVAALVAAVLLLQPTAAPWIRGLGGFLGLLASVTCARWWTLRQARRVSGSSAGSGSGTGPGSGAGSGPRAGPSADADVTLAHESEQATVALRNFLSGLPVRPELLVEAGPDFVTTLTRLRESLEELDTRTRESDEAKAALEGIDDRLVELAEHLGIELPTASAAAIHVLQTRLREAERAQEASKGARAELNRVKSHEAELKEELAGRTQTLDALDRLLGTLGEKDIGAAITAAMRMRRAGEKAAEIRTDLEQSHPDLDALVARLAELDELDQGQVGDDTLAEARTSVTELSDRIETLAGEVQALQHTYERAAERATADQIDGEIDALEREVLRLEHEHDRKIVLAHSVREADRRFREEHQPDVVRRASKYLATITDDRYDRIMVGDSGEFYVRPRCDSAADTTVAAEDLSTGATEQLYLAMRLAIMSHLDHDRERLPMFIDEAFVNWDASRRGRGFQLLAKLSQTRQVFVMTCHEPWAEELVAAGANRVDLT